MPVNLKTKKQLASRVFKVGVNRVVFDSDHLDDVADAITRENIRSLFTANTIRIKPIVGTSRGRAKVKKIQKKKRGVGQGSKKGYWDHHEKKSISCNSTMSQSSKI